ILLERQQLVEGAIVVRRAGDARRRYVDDRGVDAQVWPLLENRTLHETSRLQNLAGAHVARRIRSAGGLELDLVQHRLETKTLDDSESRGSREIRRQELSEATLQWLQGRVRTTECERK